MMPHTPWLEKVWPEYLDFARSHIDYPEIPLYEMLEETAQKYPDITYLIFMGRTFTYREVNEMADKFARALKDLGLQKGDRVAVYMPNNPYWPIAFFGILKAGCTVVATNPLYTAPELKYQMNDSGAKAIVVLDHPGFYPKVKEVEKDTSLEHVIYGNLKPVLPKLKGIIGGMLGKLPKVEDKDPKHLDFMELIKDKEPLKEREQINPKEEVALILYTGGTTGTPKGAMLTHMNFVSNVMGTAEIMYPKFGPGEAVFFGALPWFHSYGLTTAMILSVYMVAKLIVIPDPRAGDPPFTEILKAIQKYRPTHFNAVPTLYGALLNHQDIDKYDLSSIKICVSGAAPLPLELMKQWEAKTGARIVEGYGLTETSPVVCVNPMKEGGRKPGSIGVPIPDTIVKIVDIDDSSKELPPSKENAEEKNEGELAIHGPQVMKGYWNKEEENKKIFVTDSEGRRWLLTGDIGYMDENGYFYITDRKKDMINASGYKVFPREVEEVLFEHEAVMNAAVIGVPDPKRGETVKAFVVIKPEYKGKVTEDDVREFCREHLAAYKVPQYIEFREELPLSAVGKVLRRVLKEEEKKKAQ